MRNFLLNNINNNDFCYKFHDNFTLDCSKYELKFKEIAKENYKKQKNGNYTGNYNLLMNMVKQTNYAVPIYYHAVVSSNTDNSYTVQYTDSYLSVIPKVTDVQKQNIVNKFKNVIASKQYYINKDKTPWTYDTNNEMHYNFHAYDNFKNLDKVSLNIKTPLCRNYTDKEGYFCEIPVTLSNNKYKLTIIIDGKFLNNKYEFNINEFLYSSEYFKNHRISTTSYWFKVAKNEKIQIGMPEKYLILSWGEPDDINESVGIWGTHKQYVYGSGQYVYVENGFITSWQDF